jgi:hypothetical protein
MWVFAFILVTSPSGPANNILVAHPKAIHLADKVPTCELIRPPQRGFYRG